MEPQMTGEEIVISGIAGRFPNCENITELQKNLLNKTDCTTDSKARWNYEHPEIPPRIGVMKDIDKFDSLFFGIHTQLVKCMDPMMRTMLEITYGAIMDAGINPKKLKGSRCAVLTGSGFSETEKAFFFEKLKIKGHNLLGISRAMFANRISFFFGTTGPSVNIDSSCCGGAVALQEGYRVIKEGQAESAIIGASNIVLHPHMSLNLFLLGLLSSDGRTKSFDNTADGYTRSEGTVVLFLQKARDAKRIYAEVKNARTSFGNSNSNFPHFYPSHEFQANLMKITLEECGLSGKDISFVEADGSGIKAVDAEEVKAIDQVYNEGRESPLLIGSVKSNIGSCPAANPLNGVIKVITAMETGYIPPNLNFKCPSDKISALIEGRCKVVTELTPWTGDYAVVNNLALTGGSANIILKTYKKDKKNGGRPEDNLPRLVLCSGCTKEAVDFILDDMESRPVDVEMFQLMYDIFETETTAHLYRGYTLLPPQGLPKTKTREIQFNTGIKKEIWYMFSGMGSQWIGMGDALLQIPVFAEAINKCDRVLKPRGIDIVRIITEKDPKMFDNIVNSFVGIAAIQIGLVDILSSIGIQPDFLIGHSVGELGCAYADGCFTAEQMILSALSRGLASIESDLIRGSMAAVGLGYQEIKNLCPSDIDVACHNSADSSTISGPADSMKAFVAQLKAKNIFAKEVATSNIAYHSRYIAPAGHKLKKYLQDIIPTPKPRSNRWVSSSVPSDKWNSAIAQLSSAEYHTNNLLSPVLFAETARYIPSHAIVIEIAPHSLLQAIVRKSLPESVNNIPLTKRGHPDNASLLFGAFGEIYNLGYNINVSSLYPKVRYPVSRGTPSISSLVKWNHSNNWFTHFYQRMKEVKKGEKTFIINLKEEQWKYLTHSKINDKIVLPTSLYLELAWDVLKSYKNNTQNSVVYRDIQIHDNQLEISEEERIELIVMVQKGTGFFQVTNENLLLCSGTLQATEMPDEENSLVPKQTDKYQNLSGCDVYTELEMRGLQYSGPFRSIQKSSANVSEGTLVWKNDWTTFMEGIIQMYILSNDVRSAQVPKKMKKIIINMELQEQTVNKSNEIPVKVQKEIQTVTAGGIQMEGIELRSYIFDSWKNNVVTEELQVIPTTDGAPANLSDILNMTLQFLNKNVIETNVIRIIDDKNSVVKKVEDILRHFMQNIAQTTKYKIRTVPSSWISNSKGESNDIALLIVCNMEGYSFKELSDLISGESFLLIFSKTNQENLVLKATTSIGLGLVLRKHVSNDQVALLLRRRQNFSNTYVLNISDDEDRINQIRTKLNSNDCDRIIIAIRPKQCSDICKIIKDLQKEKNRMKIQIVEIQDSKILTFTLEDSEYKYHMDLDLKMNILLPGKIWGMYKHSPLSSKLRHVYNWTARQLNSLDLESISWLEEPNKKNENCVKVEYSAVNEADILLVSTKMAAKNTERNKFEMKSFGQEYSGFDLRGTRVMGISANDALSNYTSSDIDFTWKVPDDWSLEDAATVPLAYAVAYLAVVLNGNLTDRKSVFVYDGASCIGQAAINIALNIKSQVFAGHLNEEEKKFLVNNYPTIPKNQIISASGVFTDRILVQTERKGVDLLIYNGDDLSKIQSCFTCIKDWANVIVIGNLQNTFNKSVGIQSFARNAALFVIIPTKLTYHDPAMKQKLSQMIKSGVATGVVQPLARRVYPREMLRTAFNDRVSRNVFEKIIVKVQPEDGCSKALAIPRFLCESRGSYLIIEGLTNFGLELVNFLVIRGARNIVIVTESKNTRAYSSHRINLWREYGVSVVVREEFDLSHKQTINTLFQEINRVHSVNAIFDLQRIDISSKRSSMSKYQFTKHLFEESKHMFPDLQQFVVFSTCQNSREDINDILLKEINLKKMFYENSQESFLGPLVLVGPIAGIAESTTDCERKVPLLSVRCIIEELDNLLEWKSLIVSISSKSSQSCKEEVEVENLTTEKTERSKFDKYIKLFQPLTVSSPLPISGDN